MSEHDSIREQRCSRCGVTSSVENFHRDASRESGRRRWCKPCRCSTELDRYYKNPQRVVDNVRRWRLENPLARYEDRVRAHGLTMEQFESMLAAQSAGCAICGRTAGESRDSRLNIDHDHQCCAGKVSCGKCVRGLLCGTCNRGLGMFRDSLELVEAAVAYLAGWAA